MWQNRRDDIPEKLPYEAEPLATTVPSPEL
jgi:hypothetical protein